MAFSDPEHNIEQFRVQFGQQVADFGAGSGFYTFALAKAVGPHGRVYALEVQKDLVAKIKSDAAVKSFANVEVLWCDIEKLGGSKLKDHSLDAVVVSNVLFQAPDKETLAGEAARIVKPGGKLLLVEWKDSSTVGPQQDELVGEVMARDIFERAGFIYDSAISAGDHHYGMVFSYKAKK